MYPVNYDIVVIGSGPGGSTTARYAAKNGLRVLLIDKRQELGAPIQCSGAISANALENVEIIANDEFIQERIYGFGIYNETGIKTTIDYRVLKPEEYGATQKPLGFIVDRRRFDRYLMTLAERENADVSLKTEGLNYTPEKDGTCTLTARRFNEEIKINTKVIVGADGLQSQVGKWAGLNTHIKLTELASCLQFVVDGVETDGLLEIITGDKWAPGGYAWIFPKGNGYAEIGLGVTRTLAKQNAQWYLDQFMNASFFSNRFANARILEIQGGGVPLTAPLNIQYADNLILVGDAARHVNPITGGGIHTALASGKIAGEFLAELIKSNKKASKENLKEYQDRWLAAMGNKMWQLYQVKHNIFNTKDVLLRDEMLYNTMSNYFSPESEYKKI